MPVKQIPILKEELKSGMRLWDSKENKWQRILKVYLWESMIEKEPNRYYKQQYKKLLK